MSTELPLDARAARDLRQRLLAYYDSHRRDLPWRRTRDPYRIWVSEVMLQQTRVDTVVPRYERFLLRFPTVEALAAARPEEVCEEWAGLGYYSRARNLHEAACRVVSRHDGRLPDRAAELAGLPGIGRYTAGAIASIAYRRQEPVVDGNVARVLSRLDALAAPAADREAQSRLWSIAGTLARGRRPGDVNQALMELGATVCTPAAPDCTRCPLRSACRARAAGEAERYPLRPPRTQRRPLPVAFAWVESRAGVWLEQRPLDGMWAGMWQLVGAEGPQSRGALAERLGVELGRPIATVDHVLTHRQVRARVYRAAAGKRLRRSARRAPHREPLAAPLSALARKAVEAVRARTFK